MRPEIPNGWAGQIWINCSFGDTIEWCRSSMEKYNYDITEIDTDLCLVTIKKSKDLTFAILKWRYHEH